MLLRYLLKRILPKVNVTVNQTLEFVYDRIEALEANSHPPVFTKKDHEDMCERLIRLEKEKNHD